MAKPNLEDLTGRQFADWTVISYSHRDRHGNKHWLSRCVCGTTRAVMGGSLRLDKAHGCGCKSRPGMAGPTHGMSRTPEYNTWRMMKERCHNPNYSHYNDYGGRGITVCERWQKFENFYADMGPRPSPKHSLDRYPDNDGNYELGNCRWATKMEQLNNTRRSRLITIEGEKLTYSQWARKAGMTINTFAGRILCGKDPITRKPLCERDTVRNVFGK